MRRRRRKETSAEGIAHLEMRSPTPVGAVVGVLRLKRRVRAEREEC